MQIIGNSDLILKPDDRTFRVILSAPVSTSMMFASRPGSMKMISAACCSAVFMKRVMRCTNRVCRNLNTDFLPANTLPWEFTNPSPGYGKIM